MRDEDKTREELITELMELRAKRGNRATEGGAEAPVSSGGADRLVNRLVIDRSPIPQFIIDKDHKVVLWNRALEAVTGMSARDVMGTKDHWKPFYREETPCLADFLVDRKGKATTGEYTERYEKSRFTDDAFEGVGSYVMTGGEVKWFYLTAAAIRDPAGETIGAIETLEDITEQKTAEAALAESETRYRNIFENAVLGIFRTAPDGSLLSSNLALARIYGYDTARELTESISHVGSQLYVNPEDRARVRELMEREGFVERFETQFYRKDRSKVWVSINVRTAKDADGKIIYYDGTAEDISSRKEAEEALRQSEEKYRNIFDHSILGMFQSNPEGRFTTVNAAFAQMAGYASPEDMVSTITDIPSQLYVEKEDREVFEKLLLEEDLARTFEVRFQRKNGSIFWARVNARAVRTPGGRVVRYEGTLEDVTERRRTERALKESEERYRVAIESSNDGIVLLKGEEPLYVNRRFVEMFGYGSPAEITGIPLSVVVGAEDVTWVKDIDSRRQGGDSDPQGYAFRGRRRDGTPIDIEVTATSIIYRRAPATLAYLRNVTEHKRAEEALKKSEEKYRNIFENAVEGIFQSTPEGRFLSANPALARMYGYGSAEELLNSVADIESQMYVDPVDRIRLKKLYEKNGFVSNFEIELYRKDRSTMWISMNAHAVADEKGKTICYEGTAEDITERKHAEQALRRSEATLRSVFSAAPVGIVITNVERMPGWVNEGMTSITGYTSQEQKEKGARLFYASDEEYARVGRAVWGGIRKGGVGITDTKWVHKNGETRDVHLRGAAIDPKDISAGLVFTAVDVTSQKRSEQALLESEEKYRTVVENSIVGVYIIQDRLFRFLNKRFCEIYGYAFEELVDKVSPVDLTHPEDKKFVEDNIRKRITGEVPNIEYSHRAIRKDGRVITLKILGSFITYNGRPAISGTVIDITREKSLEFQLLQSQKMEAIGMLAGGVAHDFNNILTTMTGYGTLLQMKMGKEDPLQTYVAHILSASQKAAGLTGSLLAFSRQQPLSLSPVNINDVLRGTTSLLKRLLTEDVVLKTELSDEDLIVMADTTQMDQILFNLATNARDAMPRGGALTIRTRAIDLDRESVGTYGIDRPGKYAVLSVSDTGVGMDKKTRNRVFEPFFTTKEVGKGTGLGLSTVYGIVTQHDGYITVYSEPNMGTTFHIYFPVVDIPAPVELPVPEEIAHGKETILLAEDNEEVRRLIREVLARYGYNVIEAADGNEAVEKFGLNKSVIDLLILDSVMPGKNGRAAYDEIATINPEVKVFFMSGYTKDIILDKGIEDRRFDFLSKPVTPIELLKKVRQVLDR